MNASNCGNNVDDNEELKELHTPHPEINTSTVHIWNFHILNLAYLHVTDMLYMLK